MGVGTRNAAAAAVARDPAGSGGGGGGRDGEGGTWLLAFGQTKRWAKPLSVAEFEAAVATTDPGNLHRAKRDGRSNYTEDTKVWNKAWWDDLQALCNDTFGADKQCVRFVCATSGLTEPASKKLLELQESSPPGHELVVLQADQLEGIM